MAWVAIVRWCKATIFMYNAAFPPSLDFTTNIDKFLAAVEEDAAFKPFGEKLSQYKREEEVYEVYKVRIH